MSANLGLCAIMKNEGSYIYEWLSFHHYIGIKNFVLYDNGSSDDTIEKVRLWPHQDCVKVIEWPRVAGQISAYQHAIENFRDEFEWCAFIDCDEFLVPQTELDIGSFLTRQHASIGGIYIHWLMFGSSGEKFRRSGLVTERFVARAPSDFQPNCFGKTIVRMKYAIGPTNPHMIKCSAKVINDAGEEIDQEARGYHPTPRHTFFALNHYFTKSKEEWEIRRGLGKADKLADEPDFRRSDEEFIYHDVNSVEDHRACRIMTRARVLY